MPRLFLIVVLALAAAPARDWVLSREVKPDDVLAHWPLQVGNRWVYETTNLTGDPDKPHVDQWIWEIRITKHVQTSEGLVVFRQQRVVQVIQGTPDEQLARADAYLIWRGYVYTLPPEVREDSTKEGQKGLRSAEQTPDFFFPMKVGLMWAEREREDEEYNQWRKSGEEPRSQYHWLVAGKGGHGECNCMKLPANGLDLLFSTLGGPSEVFFQDGVGVIGSYDSHQGTYWEHTTKLKQFVRA